MVAAACVDCILIREMEEDGLIERKVYAEVPPRVEYSLTEDGVSLKPILDSMWAWGEKYKNKVRTNITKLFAEIYAANLMLTVEW